jgi:penicillin-binding protein 2
MSLLGPSSRASRAESKLPERLKFLVLVVFIAFMVMVVRLWQLQVVRGEEYFRQTRRNVVDSRMLPSVRGKILDRNLEPIADNRPAFNLYGVPNSIDEEALERIAKTLELSKEERGEFEKRLQTRKGDEHIAKLLFEDQSRDRAAMVEQERQLLGELSVRDEPFRYYPHDRALAHLVGYMNKINAKELDERRQEGYGSADLIGRYGLEKAWESYLRGKRGVEKFVVNAKGERIEGPDSEGLIEGERFLPPVAGHNVILTIDLPLQEEVERALRRQSSGAVAVVEVKSGRILALASSPSFDPNVMTGHLSREQEAQMLSDPRKPFIDKTLRQYYPPGSTYKFVTALAALEERLVTEEEPLTCTGSHRQGRRLFRCTGSHEKVGLIAAIRHSCNVYFWKLSERIGIDSMAEMARQFGFGSPTGIGLNGDTAGRVPTREWYEERDTFKIGHTLNAATGQGDVEVSVLQLALAYAAIANGRKLFVPLVVDRVESASGDLVVQYEPQLRHEIKTSDVHLDAIRRGMFEVVNRVGGTAYEYAKSEMLEYSGKTGTAQVKSMKRRDDDESLKNWHPDRDHAWFAGFAPSENPQIAFVVLLEHGGSGGKHAGPVGRQIVEAYFKDRLPAKVDVDVDPNKKQVRP